MNKTEEKKIENVENVQTAQIDQVSKEQMAKQVTRGVSTERQMNRCLLNFLAEFYTELKKFNENFQTFSRQYVLANVQPIKDNLKRNIKKAD